MREPPRSADGGMLGPVDRPIEREFAFDGCFDGDHLFPRQQLNAAGHLFMQQRQAGLEGARRSLRPRLAHRLAVARQSRGLLLSRGGAEAIDAQEVTGVVAAALPHRVRLVAIGQQLPFSVAHASGSGPCDMYDKDGQIRPDQVKYLQDVVNHYHAELHTSCSVVPQCSTDKGAMQQLDLGVDDLVSDGNHLSISGHRKMAAMAWTALH